MYRYQRLGELAKTKDGELALRNKKKKGFVVTKLVASVWSLCNGVRTKEEIISEILRDQELKNDPELRYINESKKHKLIERVTEILEKLQDQELVELKR